MVSGNIDLSIAGSQRSSATSLPAERRANFSLAIVQIKSTMQALQSLISSIIEEAFFLSLAWTLYRRQSRRVYAWRKAFLVRDTHSRANGKARHRAYFG